MYNYDIDILKFSFIPVIFGLGAFIEYKTGMVIEKEYREKELIKETKKYDILHSSGLGYTLILCFLLY